MDKKERFAANRALVTEWSQLTSEGITGAALVGGRTHNLFNRSLIIEDQGKHGIGIGLALSGLRNAAIVMPGDNIRGLVKSAIKQQLPIVFHVVGKAKPRFGMGDAIHLKSMSVQEAYDFSLLAHRIAELTLSPVVHHVGTGDPSETFEALDDYIIKLFLGSPDDIIDSPTPAQSIIFGSERRRIPHFNNLDIPIQLGSQKKSRYYELESVGKQKYFQSHYEELIDQALREFEVVAGRLYEVNKRKIDKHTAKLIYTEDSLFDRLASGADKLKLKDLGLVEPIIYNPYANYQEDSIKKLSTVTILSALSRPFKKETTPEYLVNQGNSVHNIQAMYAGEWQDEWLSELYANMEAKDALTEVFFGFDFTAESKLPNHQVLNQQIARGYPKINESVLSSKSEGALPRIDMNVPMVVRQYKDNATPYAKLNRFNDDTALFEAMEMDVNIKADPFQAISMAPPVSSVFLGSDSSSDKLPVLDNAICTGCGDCLVQCPYSALPSVAYSPESLLDVGIALATKQGSVIKALIPFSKNLVKMMAKVLRDGEAPITTIEPLLNRSLKLLSEQLKLDQSKLLSLEKEVIAINAAIGKFSFAQTATFFDNPERVEKGSGMLFTIAVDPQACTGCGICSQICPEQAFSMKESDDVIKTKAYDLLHIWEQMPDTPTEEINKLLEDEFYDNLAALQLSRSVYLSMVGGAQDEALSFAKTMSHLVLSVAESIMQPRFKSMSDAASAMASELQKQIHDTLSNSLPSQGFENLEETLSKLNGKKLSLNELLDHDDSKMNLKKVDKVELSRKVDLLNNLKAYNWLLQDGPSGVGRSRFNLVLDEASTSWGNSYPSNPFTAPSVVLWSKEIPSITIGLIEGEMRYMLDNIKLLRRAELEVKNKYDASIHDEIVANLKWDDLTDVEQSSVPPIIIIGDENMLSSAFWTDLTQLLQSSYPIKVVVLDSLTVVPGDEGKISRNNAELFTVMALKKAYVYQGSLGNRDSLFRGLVNGLKQPKPAFIRLLAPQPSEMKHDYFNLEALSSIAMNSRSFPTIEMNPEVESAYMSSKLSLEENKSFAEPWHQIKLSDDENEIAFGLTYADWAFNQRSWDTHFKEVEITDDVLPISEYLNLEDQTDKIPAVYRIKLGVVKAFEASSSVVDIVRSSKDGWLMLQEFSGVAIEFPEKLKEKLAKEYSEKLDQEITILKQEFADEVKRVEAEQVGIIREKLKTRLVQLASKRD